MKRIAWIALSAFIALCFIGFAACKKTTSTTVNNPATPLQNLVNSDTTLTLYHHLLLRGNDVGLLTDDSVTILMLKNDVLRQEGFGEAIVDSVSSSFADRMLRYQYLPHGLVVDSGIATPNFTKLGPPLYAFKQSNGTILFNTYAATLSATPMQVGKARVFFLSTTITPAIDSLSTLLFSDTSLTFLSEAFTRTNFYDSALISGGGTYTLLAPVNDAFRKAGYDSVGAIDSIDISALVQLLGNQVVKGTYFSSSFPATVQRLHGGDLTVGYNNGLPQFFAPGNPTPVNLLFSNQVVGPNLVLHWTNGLLSP